MKQADVCHTHFNPECRPPWLAVHQASVLELLRGYNLTEKQRSDIGWLMASYCNLLDEAGLLHYGNTQEDAVSRALGLMPPWEGDDDE